jgi:hypothetical protein
LQRGENTWNVVSRPFDKFFNRNEPGCPYREVEAFNSSIPKFWLSGTKTVVHSILTEKKKQTGPVCSCGTAHLKKLNSTSKNGARKWKKQNVGIPLLLSLTRAEKEEILEEAKAIEEELVNQQQETVPRKGVEPSRTDQEKREYSYKRKIIRQTVRKKEGLVFRVRFLKLNKIPRACANTMGGGESLLLVGLLLPRS